MEIDPQIRSLIPFLSSEEFELLEANILNDGCRDALVVWNGILLDGHNRLIICQKHNIPYRTESMDFEDMESAKVWVEENQLGRRNLTDDQRSAIAYRLLQRKSEIAKREQRKKAAEARWHPQSICGEVDVSSPHIPKERTRAAVAKNYKIPERKLRKIAEIAKTNPATIQSIADGWTTIAEAIREKKRKEIINNLENIETKEAKKILDIYDVIIIDPPWPIKKIERDCRPNQSEFDYPTLTIQEIADISLPLAGDCHIWLWTTQKYLPSALDIITNAWKLNYVCTFVWHKPGGFQPIGLPQYNCEFVVYARKGSPKFIDTKAFPVCFTAGRGSHSEKPEEFYEMVRRVTAGRRIDMFNRRPIEGFDGWGKEA